MKEGCLREVERLLEFYKTLKDRLALIVLYAFRIVGKGFRGKNGWELWQNYGATDTCRCKD